MVPSLPHQGRLDPSPGGAPGPGGSPAAPIPGWRRAVMAVGVALAVVSLAAWGVTLGLAASGGRAPGWVDGLALYGLPAAFILMGVALVAAVVDRRRR
ncbi:hypothetical protein SCMU_08590 [Sinomonas cyclohexanicum]|uniref:Uncharacterized protein n=1 Tax=Sinomonas cyclohexanicum TaxID=322009 RepID=A0ABM7PS37_SINCY|nr:hypothetical protein [Corynebacterium cyclohexanicum]BCT75017.1 hypothetical protein SCMU_08590 [Corynebacterium cyclohexanicum]